MKRNYTFIPLLLLLIVAIVACSNNSSKSAADNDSEGDATKATVQVPQFSADSAYQYIQTQADFWVRACPTPPAPTKPAENSLPRSWRNSAPKYTTSMPTWWLTTTPS